MEAILFLKTKTLKVLVESLNMFGHNSQPNMLKSLENLGKSWQRQFQSWFRPLPTFFGLDLQAIEIPILVS